MNTDTMTNRVIIPFEELLAPLEQAVHTLRAQGIPDQIFLNDDDSLVRRAMELREFRTIGVHGPRQCGATRYTYHSMVKRTLVVVKNSVLRRNFLTNMNEDVDESLQCEVMTLRDVLRLTEAPMLKIHQKGAFERVVFLSASYLFSDIKGSHIEIYDQLAQITTKDCIVVRIN